MSAGAPHDCSGDAAAYVLGALEPEETQAFERHLETCVVCRDEVAAFERVVDVLPAAAPQYKAPSKLRRRVLRDARDAAGASGTSTGPPVSATRRRWAMPAIAGALALAIAAVLVLTGGSSPKARVITATVAGPGAARVKVVGGHAELILSHFPAPPRGKVYEVWLQHGSAAPSPTRTLFSVTGQGTADVGVTGTLTGVSRLLVTPERAGGSLVPTHAPVIVAPLA